MKARKPPQQAAREGLGQIVQMHLNTAWQRPVGKHSVIAFNDIRSRVETSGAPLILDSCCGTGESTCYLAAAFPQALVLGVDKSAHRLARHGSARRENYVLLRADVNDFWRLALAAGWQLFRHYLLYPNPYPKASGFRKRWYGSPALPTLLNLGGELIVRTNWQVYAEECVLALESAGYQADYRLLFDEPLMSAFETKYRARGDRLFEVYSNLNVGEK